MIKQFCIIEIMQTVVLVHLLSTLFSLITERWWNQSTQQIHLYIVFSKFSGITKQTIMQVVSIKTFSKKLEWKRCWLYRHLIFLLSCKCQPESVSVPVALTHLCRNEWNSLANDTGSCVHINAWSASVYPRAFRHSTVPQGTDTLSGCCSRGIIKEVGGCTLIWGKAKSSNACVLLL